MSRMRAVIASMVAILFAVAACQDQGAEVNEPLGPGGQSVSSAPPTNVVATVDLPDHPESAVYDPVQNAYLVSNLGAPVGSAPFAHLFDVNGVSNDGPNENGFISRVKLSADGSVASVDKHWIADGDVHTDATIDVDELDGFTGITFRPGTRELYAVDRDEVLIFDLGTSPNPTTVSVQGEALPGANVASIDGTGPLSLPNDIVVNAAGTIWLTDTGLDGTASRTNTDAVYKLALDDRNQSGAGWTAVLGGLASTDDFGCPNGIDLDDSGQPLFLTFCSNKVQAIGSGGATTVATVSPNPASGAGVGRLDGLVIRGDGSLLFSDWRVPQDLHGVIHSHTPNAGQGIAAQQLNLPADIGFDADRERVLIPSDGDQQLKIVELNR